MAINDTYAPVKLSGDGVETDFDFDFKIYEEDDLLVTWINKVTEAVEAVKVYGTDYTVDINASTPGGTVIFGGGDIPPSTVWVLIESAIPNDQPTNFGVDSKLSEKSIERALDRQCRISQQLKDPVDRSLKLPASLASEGIEVILPVPAGGKLFGWNDDGDALIEYDNPAVAQAGAEAALAAALVAETNAETAETNAETAATEAAESAALAALLAERLAGTSVTSNAIAVASKSFTTQAGKFFGVGMWLLITSDANAANYMHGQVTAYNTETGALTVNVTNVGGSGTLTDWTIRVSGTQGPIGATGATGAAGATFTPSAANALAGSIIQVVEHQVSAVVSCATTGTTIDDTVPAITDGVEILTKPITPNHASNLLFFFVAGHGFCTSGANTSVHLHKDGGAAKAAIALQIGNYIGNFSLLHSEAAGGTSAQTWSVRLNPSSGGNTVHVNGDGSGNRLFGGVSSAKLIIMEVKV